MFGGKSKMCNLCKTAMKKTPGIEHGLHNGRCCRNHTGKSGAMEPVACVELVIEMYGKYHVIVRKLCCDDDTSIRADCSWSNDNYMWNNNTDVLPQVPKTAGFKQISSPFHPEDKQMGQMLSASSSRFT
jgi:hypothetical protein